MKKILITTVFLTFIGLGEAISQVGIGTTTPHVSAVLDVESTTKGFLPPRMTGAQRNAITSPAEGLMIYCNNCGTNGEAQLYNGTLWVKVVGGAATPPPQVGDFRDGGVVFYVAPIPVDLNGDGFNNIGLVCAVSDQSTGAAWGCHGTSILGANGILVGTGAQNTVAIDGACTTSGIAADICANLTLNGFNDWFLPSKDELNEMFINKGTINDTAVVNAGSPLAMATYWSSTEGSANLARIQSFDGGLSVNATKTNLVRVRAIRAF